MAGDETDNDQLKANHIELSDDEHDGHDERQMCKSYSSLMSVIEEIKERRAWLDDMTKLNRGDKFRCQIESEIAVVCIFL